MYSSGLPVVYLILVITLIIIYYTDKYLVLNFNKRTKILSAKALELFVRMLKFGVLLHIVTGSLMFMNKNMFEEDESFDQLLTFHEKTMIKINTSPQFLTFFIFQALIFILLFTGSSALKCFEKFKFKVLLDDNFKEIES